MPLPRKISEVARRVATFRHKIIFIRKLSRRCAGALWRGDQNPWDRARCDGAQSDRSIKGIVLFLIMFMFMCAMQEWGGEEQRQ